VKCLEDCSKAFYTCCGGSFEDQTYGNCNEDYGLYINCDRADINCCYACPADAKASTKVTTDFDVEIEGPIVDKA